MDWLSGAENENATYVSRFALLPPGMPTWIDTVYRTVLVHKLNGWQGMDKVTDGLGVTG